MTSGTNKKTVAVIAAVVAALALAGIAFVYFDDDGPARTAADPKAHAKLPVPSKLPPAPPKEPANVGGHGTGIDDSYATLRAMYQAPEGATPCESLHNAVIAEQDAAKAMKRASVFSFVAPKDAFMKTCQALPATIQSCLVPRYQARNQQACESAQAATEDVAKLYKVREDLAAPAEPEPTL